MIYFVRHGQSVSNAQGVHAGRGLDSELTDQGRQNSRLSAQKAKKDGIKIDQIIASPMKRTWDTALEFAHVYNLSVTVDDRLKEYDIGLATGVPITDCDNDYQTSNPSSEPVIDFQARVLDFLQSIDNSDQNILIVSHGGVARIIRYSYMDSKPNNFLDMPVINNSQLYTLKQIKTTK